MSRLSKSSFFGRCVLPGFASLLLVNASWGHPDDPKAKSILPPYEGPGFLAGEGGVAGTVFPSNDVTLLAWIPPGQFGASWANDCWGYVSPSGREYAIIGLSNSTGFVEVTNPGNAQIVATIAGPGSVWRDIKVYQTYAYAVSEAGSGIQVIDLSQIDEGTVELVNTVTTGGGPATHNVAINEDSGYLYRTGGGGNGLRIYSLADPANPTFVASWPDRYVHDAQIVTYTEGPYAGKEIAFCCSGFNGGWVETGIDILDVTDKQDIQLLARYQYPFAAYSHQAWLSPDRQYLYLNDELNEQDFGLSSTTHIIDVSDLSNPFQATAYTNGSTAITHNLYVRDNLIFASNYRSGLRVYDISEPLAPVEIAYFDTFPENNLTDFNGLWSNYPFLPSGIVIGSDRERGLFVWDVGGPQLTFSYPNGRPLWLNAQGESIAVQVQVEEAELVPDSATLTYDQGQGPVTVDLVPAGNGLFEAVFPAIECVNLVSYYLTIETDDGTVWRDPLGAPFLSYEAYTAEGFQTLFQDDFEVDLGWTVVDSPDLTSGSWERGVPAGAGDRGDPLADADGSGQAFLTGNGPGDTDVDGGTTTLTSPLLDAMGEGGDPFIAYAYWLSNNTGSNPNEDFLLIELSNDGGASWTLLEEASVSYNSWREEFRRIEDVVPATDQMQVRFTIGDTAGGSVVEAGVDAVRIVFFECDDGQGLPADVNGDGAIDVLDLIEIIVSWGDCPPPCPADIDGSGVVDVSDLVEVILAWN